MGDMGQEIGERQTMKTSGSGPGAMRAASEDVAHGARQTHCAARANLQVIAREAMLERGFQPDFTSAAQNQLAVLSGSAEAAEATDVRDLRELLWSSIDNDESRDLDQITVAQALTDGHVRILVAIADVDALVPKGSELDAHAADNTTSVYTPAAIFPMLPERLSTDLTSLNEDHDRLALVTEMVFDAAGALVEEQIYRARVRNHAKLAYRSVATWLDGGAEAPARINETPGLGANLRLQDKVAQQLVKRRHANGALTLEAAEARPVFAGDELVDIRTERTNRAAQLIEDFMIVTNGVAARSLKARKFPSLRRALREPERWPRIVDVAAELGEALPSTPDAIALEAFLIRRRASAPEEFSDLSLTIIKLMGRGEYAVDLPGGKAPGHFGLALRDYTHSTAPNRRFPDLVTQRLLKAALADAPVPYTIAELTQLATHCSEREGAATKVERRVMKSAAALLLCDRIGEQFDAIVTGAAPKGTWVRGVHPPVEGRLVSGFAGVDVGTRLRVELQRVDVQRGYIDFIAVPRASIFDGS